MSSSPRLKLSSNHPESDIINFPEDGLNTSISYNKYSLLPGESFCPGHLSYKYICDTWGHGASMTSSLPKDKVLEEGQAIKITYDDVNQLNLNFPEYELNTVVSYNKDSLLPGESFCLGHLSYKYICDSLESELYPKPHNTSQKTEQNTSHESPEKVSKSRKRKSFTINSRSNKTPRKTIEESQIGPDICNINLQDTPVTSKESYSEDQIFKKPIAIPRSKLKLKKNHHTTKENDLKNRATHQIELLDTKNQTPSIRLDTIFLNEENLLHSSEASTCGYHSHDNESASDLYPNTLDTTQKSEQNETTQNSEQSESTQTSDLNNTKHDSSQKIFKGRKRKCLNSKPKYNKKSKKTSTPRTKIEDELPLKSDGPSPNTKKKSNKQNISSPTCNLQPPITPARPSMSRRRTLYSPKSFESSGDITKIFSAYVEIKRLPLKDDGLRLKFTSEV